MENKLNISDLHHIGLILETKDGKAIEFSREKSEDLIFDFARGLIYHKRDEDEVLRSWRGDEK